MTDIRNGMPAGLLSAARWRKGSRSGAYGNCVEVTPVAEDHTAIRDSKAPSGPALVFPRAALTSLTRAVRAGTVHAPNAEDLLRVLVLRGFEFLHPRDANGDLTAVVGVRAHHDVIDVVRLHAEDDAIASRLPADTLDVLNPTLVLWQRTGWATTVLRQLVDLADERTPGMPARKEASVSPLRGCWVPTTPGRARWLPATA